MRRVVITGVGVVSPIGIGAKAFWENLVAGQVGVRRIAQYDPSGFPSQIGGEVGAYKINDFVPKSYRKATKVMARDIELAVIAADVASCGGAETKVVPMALMRQTLLKRVTTQHNDSPDQAIRPFDSEATGTAVGEGGGLLILEDYEHAKARSAKIYCELVGFGA